MKKRLTLTLPVEMIKYIKETAKAKGITASKFVEDIFLEFLATEGENTKLKKVS